MKATELNQLKAFLSEPRKVVITTHKGPDGDAMGSSLALYNYLIKKTLVKTRVFLTVNNI